MDCLIHYRTVHDVMYVSGEAVHPVTRVGHTGVTHVALLLLLYVATHNRAGRAADIDRDDPPRILCIIPSYRLQCKYLAFCIPKVQKL